MKKLGKIFLITLLSLFTVLTITICIVLFIVFTPERFTPVVRSQVDKFITCQSEIGYVELTFFSTFPEFGLKIRNFALINPVAGSPGDTLVRVDELVCIVDASAWWKRNEIILKGLELTGGSVNVFTDSLGKTNYDIFVTDTITSAAAETDSPLPAIDIRNIGLDDINLNYIDLALKINSSISGLSADIKANITNDNINSEINVKKALVSFEYDGEKYLQQALVKLDIPVDVIMSRQFIRLDNATVSINDLELFLNGSAESDTINKDIITDINYKFSSWQIMDIVGMVPESFSSYFKDIDADGLLSSRGNIKGILNDSLMPIMDIRLQMEKGKLKYAGFPLPVNDIEGDIAIYTDLKTDAFSYVNIKGFSAKTPRSSFSIEGLVNHLFTDIYCNLTTTSALTLDEFNQMIPDSLKINMKGKMTGKVKSAFSMSQIEKMQIEKMKLSGSLTLSGFDVTYDSISLKTDLSKIDFALPNHKASSNNTKFASATILMDNIDASKLAVYSASLQNASVTFETSDARDTTRIPDLICSFKMDSLSAVMDTISISIGKPSGKLLVSPRPGNPDQPQINLDYSSEQINSMAGKSTLAVNNIRFDTEILNDNTQKDIFLQWMAKGSLDLNQGIINMDGLSYPIEIPAIKMNFDPETFKILESKIEIDKSDFQLTGNMNNILSYFRGDSILRGDFSFVSNTTDIDQLMALTNGIGQKDSTITDKAEYQDADTSYTGPYIVPKGVDLFLTTNIKKATMGIDTATNIIGSVQVHDGILVLDGLSFSTPAARMQLTAMYRTPRKNHLYLGLDYHMLDIEISELLKMIPDIDTLMPMLRSFSGKGEFHIAVETYLDSMYNLKKSTLRGASSIKGNDLVLMDGETFGEIAKTLKFNKSTENRVDSLSAEFTIFRNEIDIYPFLIVMDKYKAVIGGRHNFDMSFDYHISVVDNPLPIKLGVDVKG
ncbi:MAG TPA: hypothetical protein DD745_17160, partial [Bacteroidales bacterium]|nr:hypothetical protein [Bacteroidales bacterium]